jgi:hypothetical protein
MRRSFEVGQTMNKPRAYTFWPQYAKDAYDEREAIAMAGRGLDMSGPAPEEIVKMATQAALDAITHYNTHCGLCGKKRHPGPCYK